MPEATEVNGYWIYLILIGAAGPSKWLIKGPDGEELGRYASFSTAAEVARSLVPAGRQPCSAEDGLFGEVHAELVQQPAVVVGPEVRGNQQLVAEEEAVRTGGQTQRL